MTTAPLPVAIVGLGGFAGVHQRWLLRLEEQGVAKLVATCDPRAEQLLPGLGELRLAERGVAILPDLEALLAAHRGKLRLVTIPTPVPLHAAMHAACVRVGLPVYLEKPPTLDPEELERMIEVEKAASVPTWVGFNCIRDPLRQAVKRRMLASEFGRLRSVRVLVSWKRTETYYGRASWAGRLLLDGRLVLDGPMGNAMAHYVHDSLHWAGAAQDSWGEVRRVRASLLRSHRIQGADSILAEVETAGPQVRIAVTHAGEQETGPIEELFCDDATIRILPGSPERVRIIRPGRDDEVITDPDTDQGLENLRACCALVAAGGGRPATTLADSRPFVQLNALAHVSTGRIGQDPSSSGTIAGIHAACVRFLAEGTHPCDQGFAWAPRPQWVTPADLSRLRAAVDALAAG